MRCSTSRWIPLAGVGSPLGTLPDLAALADPVPDTVLLRLGADASVAEVLVAQSWLADDRCAHARLVLLTRGAVATHPADLAPALEHAAVWGLIRSAQAENPDRFLLADLDEDAASEQALPAAVAAAVAAGESQLALRAGTVIVPRLTRVALPEAERAAEPVWTWDAHGGGTVLITGGTGTLGGLLARHLVTRHGVRHLLLTGRRGPSAPGAEALRQELAALGAEVAVVACDAADRERWPRCSPRPRPTAADRRRARGRRPAGRVARGAYADQLAAVLRPKAEAARNLHELTRDNELSAFVLFSSFAGVAGGLAQANYAAANSYLDALAQHRRAQGLPAVSLAWGYSGKSSEMTGTLGRVDVARFARSGMLPLSAEQGLGLLDAASTLDSPLLVPVRLDLRALGSAEVPSLLRGLVSARRTPARRAATAAFRPTRGFASGWPG